MQPTHIQQSELNAANLAAHARSAAAQAASGPATPRAARGNIPAASAGAEQTDPFASIEQASDPGDNLTFISDDTELQQREHQREHRDLVRLQQELKQEKERADKLAAEREQFRIAQQTAEQRAAAEVATRLEAQRVADARALQLQQERDAASAALALRPTIAQLQAMTAERDARPTPERLTAVSGELAGKAAELNVMRARMEAAELKAKQIVAALPPELQAIADNPKILKESIDWRDVALRYVFCHGSMTNDFRHAKKTGSSRESPIMFVSLYREPNISKELAERKKLGII